MPEPQPLSEPRCCFEPLDGDGLERLREVYAGILTALHGRDGKENAIRVLFATVDADRARIQAALKLCDQYETRGGWCKALAGVIREALEE
jgi:hypothetical protein